MVWCVSALPDVSNEPSFPSSAPNIKRLLPLQSFTRGLISMKSMLLLVPALRLQTPTCLLGLRAYLLSSSSPSPLLPFLSFMIPPFQVFPGVCESLSSPSFFFQVKTGGSKQPGSFPLLFIHFLVFFVWLLSRYPPLSIVLFLQIELRESLDLPF